MLMLRSLNEMKISFTNFKMNLLHTQFSIWFLFAHESVMLVQKLNRLEYLLLFLIQSFRCFGHTIKVIVRQSSKAISVSSLCKTKKKKYYIFCSFDLVKTSAFKRFIQCSLHAGQVTEWWLLIPYQNHLRLCDGTNWLIIYQHCIAKKKKTKLTLDLQSNCMLRAYAQYCLQLYETHKKTQNK